MNRSEQAHAYATAVFGIALEDWLESLALVLDRMADAPELARELDDTDRPFAARQTALDGLLPSECKPPVRNFLYTLLDAGDVSLLGDVLADLERMVAGGPHVSVARVTTAVPLSQEQEERFQEKLRARFGDAIDVVFTVDAAVTGGAVVRVGDRVIDGTLANRLDVLSGTLGVARAASGGS